MPSIQASKGKKLNEWRRWRLLYLFIMRVFLLEILIWNCGILIPLYLLWFPYILSLCR